MHELRSDTFTRPTEAMREAMARAEVGDDVWGEDRTTLELEERAAAAVGKEEALFVPSGTMGNAIAIRLHASQGDELYAHEHAHILEHEVGGPAALWGVQARMLPGESGRILPAALEAAVPADRDDVHLAAPRLVCVENSHMASGGRVWPLADLAALRATAGRLGLKVHMDGARLFNAAVALDVPAAAVAEHADTVQFCLSKGLGAPIGSILAGPAPDIRRARRLRKLLGGGMRQTGIVAAAGLHVLDHHVDRLAEDHANARRLAEGLAGSRRVRVDPASVETNIVMAHVVREDDGADRICDELRAVGVLAAPLDPRLVRFVTSLEIDRAGVDAVLAAAAPVLGFEA